MVGGAARLTGKPSSTTCKELSRCPWSSPAPVVTSDYARVLTAHGLSAEHAEILADADRGLRHGELRTGSGDLSHLLRRPAALLAAALPARTA